MTTPSRRTRSRKGTPEAQPAGLGDTPDLAPSAGDAGGGSPRRSTRLGSPGKAPLPDLASRASSAYGGQGRTALSEGLQSNTDIAHGLSSIQEEAGGTTDPHINYDEDIEPAPRRRQASAAPREPSVAPSEASSAGTSRKPGRPKKQPHLAPIDEADSNAGPSNTSQPSGSRLQVKRSSPKKQNQKAPSVDGTTVMDNSGDYVPPADVADATVPRTSARARPASSPSRPTPSPSISRLLSRWITQGLTALQHAAQNMRPIPRTYLWPAFFAVLGLSVGSAFWQLLPVSQADGMITSTAGTFHLLNSLTQYRDAAWTSLASWTGNLNRSNGYPWNLDRKVQSLEAQLKSLTSSHRFHHNTIKELQAMLPDEIVIRKKDGLYQIPDEFYQALKDRLDRDSGASDEALSWDTFMAKNAAQLRKLARENSDAAIEDAINGKRVISVEEFTAMLDKKYAEISSDLMNRIAEDLERRWRDLSSNTSASTFAIVQDAVRAELQTLPATQMSILAAAQLVSNSELALNHVNFFSASLGAVVDPYLTSPTQKKPIRLTHKIYRFVTGTRGASPPVTALERWDEAGDCWCAAPPRYEMKYDDGTGPRPPPGQIPLEQDDGYRPPLHYVKPQKPKYEYNENHEWPANQWGPKAQLAVLLPHTIFPTHVTIEHVPRLATLDVAAAPRKMELWVQINDPAVRARVQQEADEWYAVPPLEKPRATMRQEGEGIPDDYVRVARWTYDIWAMNHIQTFRLDMQMEEYGVGTNRAVVRATTNWGQEYTCLYRVRMHGKMVREPVTGGNWEGQVLE